MRFQPLADRILVSRKEADTTTSGGLIIPDQAKDKPQEGVVIAVGDGIDGRTLRVSPGDRILFGKYSGTEIKIHNKTYFVMREEEVFGMIFPEEGDEEHVAGPVERIEAATDDVLNREHF